MREHFRSFDSKISFFAFADIITAVSGMLIFITLLLATDLGRPTNSQSPSSDPELERQLRETLAKQAEVDAANERLQGLMASVNTAPDPKKLQADIVRLRTELAEETSKHAGMTEDLAASKSALDSQDKLLGITDVRARIPKEAQDLAALGRDESMVRDQIAILESDIASVQSKIQKLHAREGQVWLIPDRSANAKEPILATVSGTGLKIDRFNHPEQTQQFSKSHAHSGLESYLKEVKPQEQYVVFLVRPSGIGLFKDLVQTAREDGYEVGFDALEEDKDIHFTAPPPIDDEAVSEKRPSVINGEPSAGGTSGGTRRGPSSAGGATGPGNGNGTISAPDGNASAGTENGSREGTATGDRSSGAAPSGQSPSAGSQNGSAETNRPGDTNGNTTAPSGTNIATTAISGTNGMPSSPPPPPPPKPKSWWQRFLEWIGIG